MALTRKFLSALGIEADKVDEIINAHAETVNALKEERDNYKADAEKLPTVQKELDELKKSGGDPYEGKYNELKKEYDDYKAEVKAKADKAAKVAAYKDLLKDAGIPEKRLDAIIKVSDLENIELADGKIKGENELKESLKKEWADFIPTSTTTGTNTATPPANSGGPKKTKEEIFAIKDAGERQKAIAENHELFGF